MTEKAAQLAALQQQLQQGDAELARAKVSVIGGAHVHHLHGVKG